MDTRLIVATATGKIIAQINRLQGTGATAAPGLYALKIDPNLIKKLSGKFKNGSIVISGTNGKTTTARISAGLMQDKHKLTHNRQGSNLIRGVASTLIKNTNIVGNLSGDLGLWETDEATLADVVNNTKPKIILLLNLFRDQLDRYGEVNTTLLKWRNVVKNLPAETTLILNADDPLISSLSKDTKARTIYFGIEDEKVDLPKIENIADIRYCPICMSKLEYKSILTAHLGKYKCTNCDFKRPPAEIKVLDINFKKNFSSSFKITFNKNQTQNIDLPLPGLFNVYNSVAAASIADQMSIDSATIARKLKNIEAAFGRFQKLNVSGKEVLIFLIKNPTGANEVLRTIALQDKVNLLAILNDNFADGRDVSWVWDTNWEILQNKINRVDISGTRSGDMTLRLKYAQFPLDKLSTHTNISYSIKSSIKSLSKNDTLIILPTYTALLEVEKSLSKLTGGNKWHSE